MTTMHGARSEGAERIAVERQRQLEQEGWTEGHDMQHVAGGLARAAACYALPLALREQSIWGRTLRALLWPWDETWWKPGGTQPGDRVRELEKAGALVAAEIDRLLAEEARHARAAAGR